jgi:hypothetical protein
MSLLHRISRFIFVILLILVSASLKFYCAAEDKKADPAPDTLVLSNGDTLHGKLVQEAGGTVTFHSDPLGDLQRILREDHPAGLHQRRSVHAGERDEIVDFAFGRGAR